MRTTHERLRRIEGWYVARLYIPRPTKRQRDAATAAVRTCPATQAAVLAAIEAEPRADLRDHARGVYEAFMRADA